MTELTQEQEQAVQEFRDSFTALIQKHGALRWSPKQRTEAEAYLKALLSHEYCELPRLDPGVERAIREMFARNISRMNERIPQDYFVGQQQLWFWETYDREVRQDSRRHFRG